MNSKNMTKKTRIGCVIMASGLGKRFGQNKLMADFDGVPLIRRILEETKGLFAKRVVVTRHLDVEQLCHAEGIPVIRHDFPGRNDTIRLGLEAIGEDIDQCMFCPADQPLLTRKTISELCERAQEDPESIWRVVCQEQMGAPVIFPKEMFGELRNLPEKKGGGVVIRNHPHRLRILEIDNAEEIWDVDTKEDLAAIEKIWKNRKVRN